MTEIPDDVMKAASEAVKEMMDDPRAAMAPIIARVILAERERDRWLPIESAPKDGSVILAWCVDEDDPYHDTETGRLTDYGCWAEDLSRVQDGLCLVQWGGEDTDYDEWSDKTIHWPNWWFRAGSEFQEVANPTHWQPLPNSPK